MISGGPLQASQVGKIAGVFIARTRPVLPFPAPWFSTLIKRTVSQDVQLLVFYESVSPRPLSIPLGPFRIFSKIRGDIRSSRCTTAVVDTGGKWKKSSIIKVLIILFGHLWVEVTYRYIFALKFILSSQQPRIVPIICHRCHWHRRQICAGINNTSETVGKICRRCHLYRWCTLTCEYLHERISKKFETVLMG